MKLIAFFIVLCCCVTKAFSQGGATCETATVVNAGTHTADHSAGDQWYLFKNEAAETVQVSLSSCYLTDEDTYVSVTQQCGQTGIAGNDDGCSVQSLTKFTIDPADSVFIIWSDAYTTASYQWELAVVRLEAGDACTLPRDILEGENISNKHGEEQWYTYTNSSNEEKVISFIGDSTSYFNLYSTCSEIAGSNIHRYDYRISPGETILAYWDKADIWYFQSRSLGTGDNCEQAQPAVIGYNAPAYFSNVQWFTYTNNETVGKVVEASIDEFNVIYAYDACNASIPLDWAYENISLITAPGQTLYFLCSYTQGLKLNVRDIEPGDYCSDPIVSYEGLNFNSNLGLDLWYTYTNTSIETQQIKVATNESNFIRVYAGCNTDRLQTTQYNFTHTLAPNETVYFQMEKTEVYSIDIGNELQGDSCDNAITAQYGINYPSKIQADQWFQYTNTGTENKYIKIEVPELILNPIPNDFAVLSDCNANIPNLDRAYSGIAEVNPGATILIHWNNVTSWTMTDYLPSIGEFCSLAASIQPGLNSVNNANGDHWFIYKNETTETQSLQMSSCGLTEEDTYVSVHNDCSGVIVAESDDYCSYQSQLNYDILPGETIYIKWSDDFTSESYQWQFSVDGITASNNAQSNHFNVYPTSSTGFYNFSAMVNSVSVYNTSGKLMKNDQDVRSVNLAKYPQGMYILKVNIGEEIQTFKVLKQ